MEGNLRPPDPGDASRPKSGVNNAYPTSSRRATSTSMGFPMGGSSVPPQHHAASPYLGENAPELASDTSIKSKPSYSRDDLEAYIDAVADHSVDLDDFFADLKLDATLKMRLFLRKVQKGAIKGDLASLAEKFEAIRQTEPHLDQKRKIESVNATVPQLDHNRDTSALTYNAFSHTQLSGYAPTAELSAPQQRGCSIPAFNPRETRQSPIGKAPASTVRGDTTWILTPNDPPIKEENDDDKYGCRDSSLTHKQHRDMIRKIISRGRPNDKDRKKREVPRECGNHRPKHPPSRNAHKYHGETGRVRSEALGVDQHEDPGLCYNFWNTGECSNADCIWRHYITHEVAMSIYLSPGSDRGYFFLRTAIYRWPKDGNAGPHTRIPIPVAPRNNNAQYDSYRARDPDQGWLRRRDNRRDNRQRQSSGRGGP